MTQRNPMDVVELLTCALMLALASVIVGFGLLKFLPLPFSLSVPLTWLIFGWWLWKRTWPKIVFKFRWRDVLILLVLLIPLIFIFGRIYFWQLVPSGTDMATHSYIAKAIYEYDGFPKTYEPFVPIPQFGFEPTGFASIIAAVSLLTQLPIYRASLLLSVLLYPLAGLVFYTFLKQFFPRWICLITVYSLFFIDQDLTSYVGWGAHPTVASVLFLAMSVYWLIKTVKQKNFSIPDALILALFFAAGFLTHPSPTITGAYLLLIPALILILKFWSQARFKQFLGYFCFLLIGFLLCFITSVRPVSPTTFQWLSDFQRYHRYIKIDSSSLAAISQYLWQESGEIWTILVFAGAILATVVKKEHHPWFLIGLLIYALLMLNTQRWWLPFSAALYPDRVHTTTLLVFSYFAAVSLEVLAGQLKTIFRLEKFHWSKLVVGLFWLFLLTSFAEPVMDRVKHNYQQFMRLFQEEIFVSENDLIVMNWIKDHTESSAVIANNYGDAGIWLPAIAGRMVMINDAMPHSFDILKQTSYGLKPTHAFISEKPVYPENVTITNYWAQTHEYQLLFQAGESKFYALP